MVEYLMAITFIASATGGAASGTVTVTIPAGATIGQFALLFASNNQTSAPPTAPAGWTLVTTRSVGTNDNAQSLYSRVLQAGDPGASVTVTPGVSPAGATTSVVIDVFSVEAKAVDVFASSTFTGTAGSITSPAMTLALASEMVVLGFGNFYSGNLTGPGAPWSSAGAASSPGDSLFTSYQLATSAGASPTGTATITGGSGGSTCIAVALKSNVAPNAPTLNSPATGTTVDMGVTQRLAWTFSDSDVGDTQSKFDLQYRLGAGAWVPITGTTPNNYWDAAPSTFTAGSWEWQVRTYDALGFVGPWSASSFFTAASTPGVPSITAPTSGSTVSSSATVTWSVPSQTDYQVRKVADIAGAADTATIYYDSGDVVDATTRSVTLTFPVNNRWDHIQVRVKAAGLWSAWADCRVQVSWTPPMVPTIILTPNSVTASISVAITNPTPTGGAPVTSYNDVYVSSPLDTEIRVATLVPPNSTWPWKTPGAGRVYTIRAVAVGSNSTTASSV